MLFVAEMFLIFLFSSTLQAAIGFGGGVICMAILPYVVSDFSEAALYLQVIYVLYTGYLAFKVKARLRLDILLPIQIPTLIFTVVFTLWSVTTFNMSVMNIILGLMLAVLGIYFLAVSERLSFKPTIPLGITMGVVTGICNGLFSFGGPPAVLYLAPSIEDKKEFVKSMQFYFFCSNVVSLVIRLGHATTDLFFWKTAFAGWIAVFLGAFVGTKISNRLNGKTLKKLIYIFIVLDGIWMAVSSLI